MPLDDRAFLFLILCFIWVIFFEYFRFQSPKYDFPVVAAHTDEASVVLHPQQRADRHARLVPRAFRLQLLVFLGDALVLPELEDRDGAVFVVEDEEVAPVRELDLGAPADLMDGELGHGYVIRVHRVDPDAVRVRDHHVEAGRVEGHRQDRVLQLLDDLERERARVRRVAPHHQRLVGSRSRQDLLLETRRHGC